MRRLERTGRRSAVVVRLLRTGLCPTWTDAAAMGVVQREAIDAVMGAVREAVEK